MAARKTIVKPSSHTTALPEDVRRKVCQSLSAELSQSASNQELLKQTVDILTELETLQNDLRSKAEEEERNFLENKARLISDGEATLHSLDKCLENVARELEEVAPIIASEGEDSQLEDAEKVLVDIKHAEKQIEYLRWLEMFQDQCDRIRSALACSSHTDATSFLLTLVDWCHQLRTSKCSNLVQYLYDITVYWTRLVSDRVAQDIPVMLNRIGYPRPPSVQKQQALVIEAKLRGELNDIFSTLIRLRLPEFIVPSETSEEKAFLYDLLPLKYFLQPLEKRFRYHFFVTEKTNRIDKPEWYLTQVLSWIRDYADFVGSLLQPLYDRDHSHRDAKNDFAWSITMLARSKFLSTLPELLELERHFAHALDEVLTFARTLRSIGYSIIQQKFCEVLSVPEVLKAWMQMEKTLAIDRVTAFLSSETAFKNRYEDGAENPEDFKVAESAQHFVTMLKAISERYELLPTRTEQQQFLAFQLGCVESFIDRLKLLYEENQEDLSFCATLLLPTFATAVRYIWTYLEDLSSDALTLAILSSNTNGNLSTRMSSVTDDCDRLSKVSFLKHLRTDTIELIRRMIKEYGKQDWKSMPSSTEYLVLQMTPGMAELLYTTRTILAAQKGRLFTVLASRYFVDVMHEMDELIYQNVMLKNSFSTGGASQLKFDLLNNFGTVIGRLTGLSNGGITRSVEACSILTMNRGSAMLLAELFQEAKAPNKNATEATQRQTAIESAIKEIGVRVLKTDETEIILRKRNDLEIT
ncbi:hypothetical protein RvY_10841 [Ramazzottius varieornatus]|uniref:RAD50-interacting protein 1 n=1 Tax=Ramazzottius varieornatus TaxID=947166 RepID=A0A1D1VE35_RAMVA|nr:hypothetical protein RvY_10841 [Ramazzottius varieornatus]